ncbi:Ti-type conjugative transfer relaxase TraA [Rickettsiales endosymbiont of Peranema trichophorum]|uniref:Ti-type conjugative transfer relaxase TraA n=1 Tax=Rickettsiales endosymbiont of Peranema trichophorum TaxID=2486577 RepID=UPI001023E169|nr:Ti-type conjugative transfer relaxase TraA [Rickettsiales endosymbiont of Peranema trichophorum]RZI47172.1 Ti-type conjugative transfer relaxase TraA [Rickettsiales endosymbiont of Peranema trichophorum]
MAIYHFSVKIFTRSKGHSAVNKAAYRAGEKLHDRTLEKTFNYSSKKDVLYKEVLLPKEAPSSFCNREALWNAVEGAEKRKDAQVAREFTCSLPLELSHEQNIALARDFVQRKCVALGMIADMCVHNGNDGAQPHVHVMLTTRSVSKEGFGGKVTEWNKRSLCLEWREEWANYVNKHLVKAGFELKVDHRSNKEREIALEPQNKRGNASAGERLRDKVLEHEEIARSNGERIYKEPGIAVDALTKYSATFTHVELAKFVNTHTVDREQFERVYEKLRNCGLLIRLGVDKKGQERYTSQEMIEIEYRMVRQAERLEQTQEHTVDLEYREVIRKKYGLSDNQKAAFEHITGDRDAACIVGYAGSGKSYTLAAAREVWENEGYNVIGMTLSGIAAEHLEGSTRIKSYTVANREANWRNQRGILSGRDIVVVDDASMLGTRALGKIIDEARLHRAKVVLIGDPRQLQAIEAGAALRGVIERIGHVELNEIRRQKEKWQQEATRSLALGDVKQGLGYYSQKGMVHGFKELGEAQQAMASDWHKVVLEGKSSIMLAYTRKDVGLLNEYARNLMKSQNSISEEREFKTNVGKRCFGVGDRLYFLENNKGLGVKNGTLGSVTKISGDVFSVKLDKGGIVRFNILEYEKVEHGYAATIHKAEGVTVDRCFVMPSRGMDRHATYVGLSRHRERVDVYYSNDRFNSYENMVSRLCRENRKSLAIDEIRDDYIRHTHLFGNKRNIETDEGIDLKVSDVRHFGESKKVADYGAELQKNRKYSYVDYDFPGVMIGKYAGSVKIDGEDLIVLDQRNIGCCLLRGVDVGGIGIGEDVRVVEEFDERGTRRVGVIRERSDVEEREKYRQCKVVGELARVGRRMSTNETYGISDRLSTRSIYEALYSELPDFLSEFGFKDMGEYYVSTTGQKITGEEGNKGKVYVYKNNPGLLIDYTRGSCSIWDYVGKGRENGEVFEYLSIAAGLRGTKEYQVFERALNGSKVSKIGQQVKEAVKEGLKETKEASGEANKINIDKNTTKALEITKGAKSTKPTEKPKEELEISKETWDLMYKYSLDAIQRPNNRAMKYLKEVRGYSEENVRDCGLGYLFSKKKLMEYLSSQGVSTKERLDMWKCLGVIGSNMHHIVIPLHNKEGAIVGVVGRDIEHTKESKYGKYVYSKGAMKETPMVGLREVDIKEPLIIVEGFLDALRAKAVGIKNVVSLGRANFTMKQLEVITKLGVEEIKVGLDNDKAGQKGSESALLQLHARMPHVRLKELQMPEGIKDLDQLIKEKGAKIAEESIKSSKSVNIGALLEKSNTKIMNKCPALELTL